MNSFERAQWLRRGRLAAGVALLVLGIAGGRPAQAAISLGPPRELPLLARIWSPPSLAVLEDGSFAIGGVELDETSSPPVPRFLVQFFDPAGDPRGEPVLVDEQDFGIAGSLGDRYLLLWQRDAEHQTLAAFYNADGTPAGEPFLFTNPEEFFGPFDGYQFGPGPAWRILSSSRRKVGVDFRGFPVFQPVLQVFDREANALGPAVPLGPPSRTTTLYDMAINGDGLFATIQEQCLGGFAQPAVDCFDGLQMLDRKGRPRTGFVTQNFPQAFADHGQLNGSPSVAVGTRGNVLLVWIHQTGQRQHLLARLFDHNGQPLSDVLTVRNTPKPDLIRPLALANGDFLVPSAAFTGLYAKNIFLQELKTGGGRLLPPVPVAQDASDQVFALNGAGHGIVAWLDSSFSRGFFRLFSAGGR